MKNIKVFQAKCNITFKVKATAPFNVSATEAPVKVGATPCCI